MNLPTLPRRVLLVAAVALAAVVIDALRGTDIFGGT
jgi:hypothetical protein